MIESNNELSAKTAKLAENVSFLVATKTRCGQPIQDARGRLTDKNVETYRPDEGARELGLDELQKLGFKILRRGRFGTTVSGPAALLSDVLGQKMMVMRQARKAPMRSTYAFPVDKLETSPSDLFLAPATSLSIRPTRLSPMVDHFVFAPPAMHFMPAMPQAPVPRNFHALDSTAIRQLLNVPSAGEFAGLSGNGIKVAIVDTGFNTQHPFYQANGVNITAHSSPGGSSGEIDSEGHGTAMASVIFGMAPGAELHGIKQEHPPYTDAVEMAVDEFNADIVTCSWGWDREQSFALLEASIVSLIQDGKLVLFAAGNGQYAWPGSMPDVLSVGGVYADSGANLEASNYASGYMSGLYPQRQIPDFCGLCGQVPKAIYIPMPVPEGSAMDIEFSDGAAYPDSDETGPSDGWVFASGTSAATPQVAGALALLLEAARAKGTQLTNAIVKNLLQKTARAVSQGQNAMGFPATAAQPNGAVGHGLVNVDAMFAEARRQGLV